MANNYIRESDLLAYSRQQAINMCKMYGIKATESTIKSMTEQFFQENAHLSQVSGGNALILSQEEQQTKVAPKKVEKPVVKEEARTNEQFKALLMRVEEKQRTQVETVKSYFKDSANQKSLKEMLEKFLNNDLSEKEVENQYTGMMVTANTDYAVVEDKQVDDEGDGEDYDPMRQPKRYEPMNQVKSNIVSRGKKVEEAVTPYGDIKNPIIKQEISNIGKSLTGDKSVLINQGLEKSVEQALRNDMVLQQAKIDDMRAKKLAPLVYESSFNSAEHALQLSSDSSE